MSWFLKLLWIIFTSFIQRPAKKWIKNRKQRQLVSLVSDKLYKEFVVMKGLFLGFCSGWGAKMMATTVAYHLGLPYSDLWTYVAAVTVGIVCFESVEK